MSYTALYRKFRPDTFEDVKGQDHIVTTLKNQIKNNRLGHAYLFCGTRGTGKTTIAKILGKAVNCENPVDGNPCGECKMCKAIAAGTSMNLIEIDAASNNGVENIREIKEEVLYSPTEGKYKVYIIDEVHMLSISAFNALLKTLEEPPSYVIFILATTEVHKIPITILSRCQRYDFKRISVDTITARLSELMAIENVNVEEKAIRYIAKMGDGSLRDSLSILDQCLAFYMGQDLKYDNVLDVLGAVDSEIFSKLFRLIIDNDTTGCMYELEELVNTGRDLSQFVVDFTWYLRNILLVKTSNKEDVWDIIGVSSETLDIMSEEAKLVETDILLRYIRIFSELCDQIKYQSQKRIFLETALIKLTRPQMENDLTSLIQRIKVLEDKVEKGLSIDPEELKKIGTIKTVGDEESSSVRYKRSQPIKPTQEECDSIAKSWKEVVAILSELHYAEYSNVLQNTYALVGNGDNELVICNCSSLGIAFCDCDDGKNAICEAVSKMLSKEVELDIKFMAAEDKPESYGFTTVDSLFTMDVEVNDEEEY